MEVIPKGEIVKIIKRVFLFWTLLTMLAVPIVAQAQFVFSTNSDNTITLEQYYLFDLVSPVTVPDTVNSLPVTRIGVCAFGCTSISGISIPNTVTNIGDWAFNNCNHLTDVTIPDGVISMGTKVFLFCTNLTYVTIGNGLKNVGTKAFANCNKLASVTLGDGVKNIGDEAFCNCGKLTSLSIGNGVTNIDSYAFFGCRSLMNVTIPDSTINIGLGAFAGTSLGKVTIPDNVVSLGDGAFAVGDNLKGLYFKGNTPSLGGPDVFYADNNATVYYLPGTTNWGSSYGGRPTALFNPTVRNDSSFGIQANCFGFTFTNAGSPTVVVEACTNLTNPVWSPVATNTLTDGSSYFGDPDWTNHPVRFYRLQMPK